MKFVYPDVDIVIDTDVDYVNSIVIENPNIMFAMLQDINEQIMGNSGISVVSDNNKILEVSKSVEVITQFIPFEINKKSLINKFVTKIATYAKSAEYYEKTMEVMSEIESYLIDLLWELDGNFEYDSIAIDSIIKAIGIKFREDYNTLSEKIIDYIELVTEYERKKLFFLVNLRSYVDDKEIEFLIETALGHNFNIILIDNCEHRKINNEKRYTIDNDRCIIS